MAIDRRLHLQTDIDVTDSNASTFGASSVHTPEQIAAARAHNQWRDRALLEWATKPLVLDRLFPRPPPAPLTLGQRVRRRLRTFHERIQACREILAGKHDGYLPLDHSE